MENKAIKVPFSRTYIQDKKGNKYYFDINTDTSKSESSDVADAPIDARKGATLQDKRVVNMKTIGLSGKFSSRYTNGLSFRVSNNRIGTIINYFEKALTENRIYTVCKKGSLYENMMLNDVDITIGEYISTVEIALSFIEVNIISLEIKDAYKMLTNSSYFELAKELCLDTKKIDSNNYVLQAYPPILAGNYKDNYLWVNIYNPNGNSVIMEAQISIVYRQDGDVLYLNFTRKIKGKSGSVVNPQIFGATDIEIECYFKPLDITTEKYSEVIKDSNSVRLIIGEEEESSSSS